MKKHALTTIALAAAIGLVAIGAARADCESDLIQLEQAFKAPNLTAAGKAALEEAKTKGVTAMRKDDDAACHAAIAQGMAKAGLMLQ